MCWRSIASSWLAETAQQARTAAARLTVAFASLAALGACAVNPTTPDLKRLYQSANLAVEQPPLILIPGIMGSQLRDRTTHRLVWPGSIWRLAFHTYEDLALTIDPATLTGTPGNIEAFDITNTAAGQHFYDTIIDTLVNFGGFTRTTVGTPVTDHYERHLYVLPYDWRLDNVTTAQKLSEFIDQLRADYGQADLKVDIVAHSMGGIIARYLLRFGTEDALDRDDPPITMAGESKVNKLILLGTPSLGSTNAVQDFIDGEKLIVERIAQETLATLPTTYQLFPNSVRKPLIGIDGRPLRTVPDDPTSPERDVFDVDTWRDLKWSVFSPEVIQRVGPDRAELLQRYFAKHLKRAGRLQRALRQPQASSNVKMIVFGADCMLTPSRVLVEEDHGRMVPRYEPREIKHPKAGRPYETLLREPGDGLVGKASLLGRQSLDPTVGSGDGFPIAFSFFLCVQHSDIPGNINFQDNLLNVLLSR